MMKTNAVPAVIMLTAGFIDCILAIYYHLSLGVFTRQLFLVLVIFYIIGCVVKVILDRNFPIMEEETSEEEAPEEEEPQEDMENIQGAEASEDAPSEVE
jgi:phosphotransferase system  glucose/maltose/N-acetylglucosamine-specific IIC component